MPPEVFICHSAKDNQAADRVCAALEAEGVKCWIASRDVRAGAVWAEAITQAIDTCKVMVILISSDTIRSQHQVIREIELADARNTALLPLFIESITLSKGLEYYLKNRQWIDASTPPLERHMPSLIRAVRELLTGEVTPLPPHQKVFQPSQRKSRRWLIIGTVAPLIVAFAILTYKGCSRAGRENDVKRQSTINGQEEARNFNVQASRPSCKDYGVTIAQHTQKVAEPRQPVLLTGTVNPLPPGYRLWVAALGASDSGEYWPRGEVKISGHSWTLEVLPQLKSQADRKRYAVFLVGPGGQRLIQNYRESQRQAAQNREWPAMTSMTSDMEKCPGLHEVTLK